MKGLNRGDARFLFDALNVHIVRSFLEAATEKKIITTWDIAKSFHWGKDLSHFTGKQRHRFFSQRAFMVRGRLLSMAEEGIIRIDKENEEDVFTLLVERVGISKYRIQGKPRSMLMIRSKNEKWAMYEL